jgi:CheY-like chemotaxis protein
LATTAATAATPLRILLAEDNPVNQRVAQLMLSKLGHQVTIVGNGVAAVAAVVAKPYDVVLMDIQMPELDGLDATRQIRERVPAHQQPYIIAVTASALVEDREACAAAGMESYLTKPIRAQELKSLLNGLASAMTPAGAPGGSPEQGPEGPARPPGPPAVDEHVLDQLIRQLDDPTGEVLGELVDSYLSDSGDQLPDLLRACDTGEATRVLEVAHTLRSTSGLLGATHLVELLREAEATARSTPADLPSIARLVEAEHVRVSEMLQRVRNRPVQLVD